MKKFAGSLREEINNAFYQWFQNTSSARILAEGFLVVIVIGTILLWLPVSTNPGYRLSFIDAFFTSTSAVCVTGLAVTPTSLAFTVFGKTVLALLIQIGGMGIVLFLLAFLIFGSDTMGMKTRTLFIAAQNLFSYRQIAEFARRVVRFVILVEGLGALLSFFVFLEDYPPLEAMGLALFHSISAFNNAGFDIFGGSDSMLAYAGNVPMVLITSALVIIGGFGFTAAFDLWRNIFNKKHCPNLRRCMLTTKITLLMTIVLLAGGTVFFVFFTRQNLLEAWFQSVIARTAGFATFPLAKFSQAGLIVFIILMYIGASPGSTGGGVKTNTIFAAFLKAFSATAGKDKDSIFFRRIPESTLTKSFIILLYGASVIVLGTLLISLFQPEFSLMEILVEVTSAFATVGSSMGITSSLNFFSKIVIIICMFIGRLGPITIANLLVSRSRDEVEFAESNILIG